SRSRRWGSRPSAPRLRAGRSFHLRTAVYYRGSHDRYGRATVQIRRLDAPFRARDGGARVITWVLAKNPGMARPAARAVPADRRGTLPRLPGPPSGHGRGSTVDPYRADGGRSASDGSGLAGPGASGANVRRDAGTRGYENPGGDPLPGGARAGTR